MADISWSTVCVAIVSALAAIGGNTWMSWRAAQRESKSVRASLIAEVRAMVELVEQRKYLEDLRELQRALAEVEGTAANIFEAREASLTVLVHDKYNEVYLANLDRLGSLSASEAGQVVRFHKLLASVVQDVKPGGVLAASTTSSEDFKETADLLEAALDIGHRLIT